MKRKVSIVVFVFNEGANLPDVYRRLTPIVDSINEYDFEILLIDNCSEDDTEKIAIEFVNRDSRWRYLRFSKNFGLEVSLAASLHYSSGEALIFLAGDLQDPPEKIPFMIEKWNEGYDVVYGIINKRNDCSRWRSIISRIGYKLIYCLTETKIPPNVSDFRLISRPVVEALKKCEECNRFMRGMVHWVGFRQIGFPFDRAPRIKGKSSIGWSFLINFAINGVTSFSARPLRWAGILGCIIIIFSIISALFYSGLLILHWMNIDLFRPPPAGLTTLIVLILFFGGIQCLFIGILGEYLGKVYIEVKKRPLWIIQKTAGFSVDKGVKALI